MTAATVLPFPWRADLAARAAAKEDSAREAAVGAATDAGLASVATLLAMQGGDDEASQVALWGAVHGALHALAKRGAFTDRRDALGRVEKAPAAVLPGPWIAAR